MKNAITNFTHRAFEQAKPSGNLLFIVLMLVLFQACKKDGLEDLTSTQITFPKNLSDYHIYQGSLSDLKPASEYVPYKLGSTLFTDFAEKQRLIKLPEGTQMEQIDDDNPAFPDGTVIAKTFYYYHDKRAPAKGKRIIETRLLVKQHGSWNAADYLWNKAQTDAQLIEDGLNTTVNFVNERGEPKVFAYRVPNNRECVTCHSSNDKLIPIGTKLRNLNIETATEWGTINQLSHFENLGMLKGFNPAVLSDTPDFHDTNLPVEDRARGYLDINCGHCHNPGGFAAKTDLFLNYEIEMEASNIAGNKDNIVSKLESGTMPYLGTSVVDEAGVQLIKQYLETLP